VYSLTASLAAYPADVAELALKVIILGFYVASSECELGEAQKG